MQPIKEESPIQVQAEVKPEKKKIDGSVRVNITAIAALVVALASLFYFVYLNSNQKVQIAELDLRLSKVENTVKDVRADTQELQESTETTAISADGLVVKSFVSTKGGYQFNYPEAWKIETFELNEVVQNVYFGPGATVEKGLGQVKMIKYDKSVDAYLAENESEVEFENTTRGVINGVSVTKADFKSGKVNGFAAFFIKNGTIYSLQLNSIDPKDKVLFDVLVKSFEIK
ncbi:TPA: hypothetical protein DF272_05920 [Candidatus Falkowbacteria bacterium]|nr:hypothetical protein [Candidatus Falkowbacteria bacterium]